MKTAVAAVFSVLILGVGVGCAVEDVPAEAKEEVTVTATAPAEGEEEPVVEEEEPEPEPDYASVGDVMDLVTWDVKVTKVVKNANDVVASTNMYNEKPQGQYVLVTYDATYTGSERNGDVWMDLSWSFTGTDNKTYIPSSQVLPSDNEEWPTTARKGGTVTSQIVFDVPGKVIDSGLLSVEAYDEEFNTIYADFLVK